MSKWITNMERNKVMKTRKLIVYLAVGAGLLAQPLTSLAQITHTSSPPTGGSAVVVPAVAPPGTNSFSAPRDPAVDVAVAFETLQVIRARAAANTNAPQISVDQIRERTESVLDEIIKKLQVGAPAAPAKVEKLSSLAEQSQLGSGTLAPVEGAVTRKRTVEDRLADLEVRVSAHAKRLENVEQTTKNTQ